MKNKQKKTKKEKKVKHYDLFCFNQLYLIKLDLLNQLDA